jgi:hypothetical protein
MPRIIDPTQRVQPERTLKYWLESFGCVQECAADASDNSEIKRSVDDNIKLLKSRVKEKADPQAPRLLEEQLRIRAQMWMRRPEMHNEMMKLWRQAAQEIKIFGWDLGEEVHYGEVSKGGKILFWQGDKDKPPTDRKFQMDRLTAVMAIKFLKFVAAESQTNDPVEYTKQTLLKQGINADNFHLYADRLAFPNPWTS